MSDSKAPFLRSTVKVVRVDAGPLRVKVKVETEPRKPIKMIVPVYKDETPARTVTIRRIIPE